MKTIVTNLNNSRKYMIEFHQSYPYYSNKICRQRIKMKVLMMPKDYMIYMLLKDLLKTKQLIKMDDPDSL